jgi:hypothetical protein
MTALLIVSALLVAVISAALVDPWPLPTPLNLAQ